MLLNCPSCATKYVVPDNAIGVNGRQVRCANCKHSWFQQGPELAARTDAPEMAQNPPIPPAPKVAAPKVAAPTIATQETPQQQATQHDAAQQQTQQQLTQQHETPPPAPSIQDEQNRPSQQAVFEEITKIKEKLSRPKGEDNFQGENDQDIGQVAQHMQDVSVSHFSHEPPFKPRRNPAKLWTIAAIIFALIIAGAAGALAYFGPPSFFTQYSQKEPDLKIVLPKNFKHGETGDGTKYFIASGTIVNPTSKKVDIPVMIVTLRDAKGIKVHQWEMNPPVAQLAPGATVDFSEAQLDVPRRATKLFISWKLN
ncbi:hypothetical protein LPB140_00130 [Sphingorhabdus lutea]|uniref:Zinc finger/thioredoxin putative domain-containing protein n=1 Tax=Sphingorhabdus lutea TaxID=1913578 RepID=A0A1L3J8P7_9SPHN|nr:zinc-ribbon domain-containing protein [Sphingorhabdus lutea]APG61509.1 hypothetical protein LPB140_00130 [Sphingorhabdus lutea]